MKAGSSSSRWTTYAARLRLRLRADSIAPNGSAREVMKSDTLRLMARELAEAVRKMPKLDWTQRESVRADLRRNVRRLLANLVEDTANRARDRFARPRRIVAP